MSRLKIETYFIVSYYIRFSFFFVPPLKENHNHANRYIIQSFIKLKMYRKELYIYHHKLTMFRLSKNWH